MARILILEDDVDLRELYILALKAGGHRIAGFFSDPASALSCGKPADVIVLDERLGEASGLAWLPRLRQAFPRAKILMISVDANALQKASALGVDAVRLKPFPLGDLLEEIHALL